VDVWRRLIMLDKFLIVLKRK